MMDNTLLNKSETLSKCLKRIEDEYREHEHDFTVNFTVQDAIMLNLERAIQACIDAGAHIIRKQNLGIPQANREVFEMLFEHGYISNELSLSLQQMVGFRNILVHDYKRINLDIVVTIIKEKVADIDKFKHVLLSV